MTATFFVPCQKKHGLIEYEALEWILNVLSLMLIRLGIYDYALFKESTHSSFLSGPIFKVFGCFARSI